MELKENSRPSSGSLTTAVPKAAGLTSRHDFTSITHRLTGPSPMFTPACPLRYPSPPAFPFEVSWQLWGLVRKRKRAERRKPNLSAHKAGCKTWSPSSHAVGQRAPSQLSHLSPATSPASCLQAAVHGVGDWENSISHGCARCNSPVFPQTTHSVPSARRDGEGYWIQPGVLSCPGKLRCTVGAQADPASISRGEKLWGERDAQPAPKPRWGHVASMRVKHNAGFHLEELWEQQKQKPWVPGRRPGQDHSSRPCQHGNTLALDLLKKSHQPQ